jgi:hypothetical protein
MHNRKAEPSALANRARCKKGLENTISRDFVHPYAIVGDRQADARHVGKRWSQGHISRSWHAWRKSNADLSATVFQRVDCVIAEIQYDLANQSGLSKNVRAVVLDVDCDRNIRWCGRAQQKDRFLNDGFDIDSRKVGVSRSSIE